MRVQFDAIKNAFAEIFGNEKLEIKTVEDINAIFNKIKNTIKDNKFETPKEFKDKVKSMEPYELNLYIYELFDNVEDSWDKENLLLLRYACDKLTEKHYENCRTHTELKFDPFYISRRDGNVSTTGYGYSTNLYGALFDFIKLLERDDIELIACHVLTATDNHIPVFSKIFTHEKE